MAQAEDDEAAVAFRIKSMTELYARLIDLIFL